MSEINKAGNKGYVILAVALGLLLFVILVVSIYKANQDFVPQSPDRYSMVQDYVSNVLA